MIELIRYDERDRWNKIVNSYRKKDVYYYVEYAESFMKNEDGIPYLLCYEGEKSRFCYPVIEKDIADFPSFYGALPHGKYFDWNTPYGYGGPLCDEIKLSDYEQQCFHEELLKIANDRGIISQFIRFHPLLQNQMVCDKAIENVYVKDTIFINLDTQDDLMRQMDSKNRNLIRKAIKSGIVIEHDKGQYIDEFMSIYNTTMKRDNARDYYYFPRGYYEFMQRNMSHETEYFYAFMDGKMVASSIFFYGNEYMHYHLSGNLLEYRTFAPTNLILYEAAKWGREIGMKSLHLGGGVGIEDSLFHFKKQFNKDGRIGFCMGRNIFMTEEYKNLLTKRKEINDQFDMNNPYYIQYRQP